jgi:tetratricopeptide (TPR) repeat protein
MLESVAAAFDRQDYKTAAQLLKPLKQQHPDHPLVQLYVGRLYEVSGKLEAAEASYRQLLQATTNSKVVTQARQGLQRLAEMAQQQKVAAIAEATANPDNVGMGVLILEPVSGDSTTEHRQAAAQHFARIMKLDAYTARLQLPSRGWRLYRVGATGELEFYGQELRKAGIPAFWVSLEVLKKLRVFRVDYLQAVSPQAIVVCQDETNQVGALTLNWSEISHRVDGLLPIFEDVVDLDGRRNLMRKEKTQDYAQVLDLHVPKRNCILRFCDRTYQFQQGVLFDGDGKNPNQQSTIRMRWNLLAGFLGDRLNVPMDSDFTPFAENAQEHFTLIKNFPAHIDLFRKAPTYWDEAFQLYSGLIFEHSSQQP